jgi:ribosomal protein S18 acetylase RimI-like enzyme
MDNHSAEQPPSTEKIFNERIITSENLSQLAKIRASIDLNRGDKDLLEEAVGYAQRDDRRAIVMEDEKGEIAGYIEIKIDEDLPSGAPRELFNGANFAHLARIGVEENFRRMGVAKRLMVAAETYALEHGKSGLWLDCLSKNDPALALYESCGYQEVVEFFDERKHKQRKILVKNF